MQEFYEEFHYVVSDSEIVVREVPPLEERLSDQNQWIAADWERYNSGNHDAEFGWKPRSHNPFYQLGYDRGMERYKS